jgi:hypothetical protein
MAAKSPPIAIQPTLFEEKSGEAFCAAAAVASTAQARPAMMLAERSRVRDIDLDIGRPPCVMHF